ncbi:hypothetical protein BRC71_06290 [Halobacteriales archaeon QH_7_65_31]|nr:MAG: hypothetical protein BRC71_06290 [Halobacteriales archaeon QH_7_65_31]
MEFGTLAEANEVREEHAEIVCPLDDDRRLTSVAFVSDVDPETRQTLETRAAASRGDRESGPGQVALSDGERDRLDFTRDNVNVPKYRAIKGIATEAGVDDWLAHADRTLVVDEHRELMERAARDEQGQRMDAERSDEQRAEDLVQQAGGGDCEHARGHCEHGDVEACEFLHDRCGYDESDVQSILGDFEGENSELSGAQLGALSRAWSGHIAAVNALNGLLARLREEWSHAQQAARAINDIRSSAGQEPLHFEELEERQAQLTDIMRAAAADCVECHADHSGHDHAVTRGHREELTAFLAGAGETPVGTADERPSDADSKDPLVDDRDLPDGDEGLFEFAANAPATGDGQSREHRRAQNDGYLRSGNRGFDEGTSARDGLGEFAATGGEETLDSYEDD